MLFLQSRTICSQVLHEISDRVTGGLEGGGGERHAACRLRPEAGGVVHVVIRESLFFDLFRGQVSGQLMNNGADHLHMV